MPSRMCIQRSFLHVILGSYLAEMRRLHTRHVHVPLLFIRPERRVIFRYRIPPIFSTVAINSDRVYK